MDKPFRIAYYIAKNERPFTDFKELLQLQKINGPDVGEKYFIDKATKECVSNITEVLFDELKELLHDADYFNVFCDGSTDRIETDFLIRVVNLIVIT